MRRSKGKRRRRDDGDGAGPLYVAVHVGTSRRHQRATCGSQQISISCAMRNQCAIARSRDSVSGEVQLKVMFSFVVLPD